MDNFMNVMKTVASRNSRAVTENGAVGYETTGRELLDLNFAAASYRSKSEKELWHAYLRAYTDDPVNTMVWLFYCRDIRGGMGERRFFRTVMRYMSRQVKYTDVVNRVLPLVAEYGRWDDILILLDECLENVERRILRIVVDQLKSDVENMKAGKEISLLAKWMPSDNASSKKSLERAKKIAKEMKVDIRTYRKIVHKLREYLDIVERSMSRNEWGSIDYERVPSCANLLYKKAFMRHDEERRIKYIESLKSGEKKINASAVFPHDIVTKFRCDGMDSTLEAMWSALPDYAENMSNTLVVRDGSGSMIQSLGKSRTMAHDVSTALAIYFSERCSGPFKNQFITFSSHPSIVNLNGCETLHDKLVECYKHADYTNTDIQKVFELILRTACLANAKQEEMPETILIISDMEFDGMTCAYKNRLRPIFERFKAEFAKCGYKLPKIAFWNVASRTNVVPLCENSNGVVLVSGFAPATVKMVMQKETDPYKAMMNILNSERYAPVRNALENEWFI